MRYAIVALGLTLAGCATGPTAQMQRYPRPMLILDTYQPPQQPIYSPRQPITCSTNGGITNCF